MQGSCGMEHQGPLYPVSCIVYFVSGLHTLTPLWPAYIFLYSDGGGDNPQQLHIVLTRDTVFQIDDARAI